MSRLSKILTIIGIIFISFNLRAPITSVGSMIDFIKGEYILTNSMAGFITTLPLIIFALVSPFVSKVSSKIGYGFTMIIGLILILVGELIRSYTSVTGLFIGTAMIGSGIAIGNVLIPSIIKLKFSEQIGLITSIYTTSMCIFAAIGSGSSIPLAKGMNLGWKNALAIWTILAIISIIVWIPQLKLQNLDKKSNCNNKEEVEVCVWKSKLAWWVTLFMGTQSLIFYCLVAWLPTIIISKGMNAQFAGNMTLLFQMISLPATLCIPIVANKFKDQRKIATTSSLVYLLGMIILLLTNNSILLIGSIALLGIGMGGSISLSIAFISLRTPNAKLASELSGMSQSAGYLLAAIGPMLIGFIVDLTQSWNAPILILIGLIICLILFGLKAGSDEVVEEIPTIAIN